MTTVTSLALDPACEARPLNIRLKRSQSVIDIFSFYDNRHPGGSIFLITA